MKASAERWYADAVTVAKQVGTQRQQLRDLRKEALTALAFVKPGARKADRKVK